jgi:hypothetical protein
VKKYRILVTILILLCCSLTIIYYLVKANFYTGGVFRYGAITGFLGCLFLVSLTLTFSQMEKRGGLTKKHGLVFSMLILSGSVAATFYFYKPGDSDIWWYGTIAGFLSCLSLALLILAFYMATKLLNIVQARSRPSHDKVSLPTIDYLDSALSTFKH